MLRRFREFRRLTRDMRAMSERAALDARRLRASSVESEHLFAAIAAGCFGAASQALAHLGISHSAVVAAIEREHASALALAGVRSHALPPPTAPEDRPAWGRSAMRAAERSCDENGPDDPRLRVLLGIVHAEAGVMPRVLQELGVTSVAIDDAVQEIATSQR